MKTNDTPPADNTVDFRAFAPFFTLCPCRACAHRKKSLITDADGSVVACAHYNAALCKGCPAVRAIPNDAA